MKTKIETKAFAEAAAMAAAACAKDALSPFSRVTLSASSNYLTATGGDGDVQVSVRVQAATDKDWSYALPGALLARFAGALPPGVALLTGSGNGVSMECAGVRFRLSSDDGVASMTPPDAGVAEVYLPAIKLREILRKTKFAMSQDKTRTNLNGVNFKLAHGTLGATATDGRRLAHVECDVDASASWDGTLPRKTVDTLFALLKDDGDVAVRCDGRVALFTSDKWILTTKLVDGVYPLWRKVVPEKADHKAVIGRVAFVDALERAALSAEDGGVAVGLGNGRATFGAKGKFSSAGSEVPDCKLGEGEQHSALYDARILLDALKASDDDELDWLFEDAAGRPVMIRGCGGVWIVVIMPMRVK